MIPTGRHTTGAPTAPGVSPRSPVNKQQVQIPVEHLPVQLRERQALPAALAENAKHHFGCLHFASLMVPLSFIACAPSPCGPDFPVSRLGGRYPADYYRHSVAIGLASRRRSHVHTAVRIEHDLASIHRLNSE